MKKMANRGVLVVLSGPAGTGKGTVCKEFLSRNEDSVFSVSATTRSPRPGERDGVDYFFITKEKYGEMVKNDEFLEHAEFCGNCYGTPKAAVEQRLSEGKNVILEIDVQGALQIKEKVPDSVLVFIAPPSQKILRERIEGRGTETPEVIDRRMEAAKGELAQIPKYDYVIVNDEVDKAVLRFETIINAERYKTKRNELFIQEVCK